MEPRIVFTLLCDDAREEKSRKLIIVGLYNYSITFAAKPPKEGGLAGLGGPAKKGGFEGLRRRKIGDGAPGPEGQSIQRFALPQLCIVRRWYVDSPGYKAKTELIEPNGQGRVLVERELPVVAPDNSYQEMFKIGGFVLHEGEYIIRTSVDARVLEERFVVRRESQDNVDA